MTIRMDLNADVGEECADDDALFAVVTTANVAAGGHAGGDDVLERTVRSAAVHGVAVGAHPSYADRAGFGRVSRWAEHDEDSLVALVVEQSQLVAQACRRQGVPMTHVKAHGALFHDAGAWEPVAHSVARAVQVMAAEFGLEALAAVGLPGSALEHACAEHGVTFIAEAYADRAYAPDGTLVPRSVPGAVVTDPAVVCQQVLDIAVHGRVVAIDGTIVDVPARSICLHGDTPGAVDLARQVRAALEGAAVTIAAIDRP